MAKQGRVLRSFTTTMAIDAWLVEQCTKNNVSMSAFISSVLEKAASHSLMQPPKLPTPQRSLDKKQNAKLKAQYEIDRAKYEAELASYNASKI